MSSSSPSVSTSALEQLQQQREEASSTTTTTSTSTTISASTTAANSSNNNNNNNLIRLLPSHVVDRIKAGEVVQRAASAVKELLENSLDAGSTEIVVTCSDQLLTVSDNGHGIRRDCLSLAWQRHATSKLRVTSDLQCLDTFGFRGEALASIASVARVTITSRTADSAVAYKLTCSTSATASATASAVLTPCARAVGTTVAVADLFYNVPTRRKRPWSTEYPVVLQVVQHYAMLYASRGVAVACQKKCTTGRQQQQQQVDLNTRAAVLASSPDLPEEATKRVIAQVYGTPVASCLLPFQSQLLPSTTTSNTQKAEPVGVTPVDENYPGMEQPKDYQKDDDDLLLASTTPCYTCHGWVTSPSYQGSNRSSNKKSSNNNTTMTLILFVNRRLVECPPLKRALQDVGASSFFVFIQLQVPPSHVDVNVHPTKQQVTLLHLDEICQHISQQLRHYLAQQGHVFAVHSKQPPPQQQPAVAVPHRKMNRAKAGRQSCGSSSSIRMEEGVNKDDEDDDGYDDDDDEAAADEKEGESSKDQTHHRGGTMTNPYKRKSTLVDDTNADPLFSQSSVMALRQQPKAVAACKKIRTSRSTPIGALEPFLVSTQRLTPDAVTQSTVHPSTTTTTTRTPSPRSATEASFSNDTFRMQQLQHQPDCPLLRRAALNTIDLSQPGAFAMAAAQCTCRQQQQLDTLADTTAARTTTTTMLLRLPRQALPRPQKMTPTPCSYSSITQLRKLVHKKSWPDLDKKLRSACFVGVVSHQRSLIQCRQELILMNHYEAARELFYQLALNRFGGGAAMARFGHDVDDSTNASSSMIDVATVIGHCVQLEEMLQHLPARSLDDGSHRLNRSTIVKISDTNQTLAEQAAACLLEHSEMLSEYFSIAIRTSNNRVVLTGLPVLLEGYEPLPHGLPLFLLRLATEVDWSEEKPCFYGICRELGSYYAELPHEQEEIGPFVRHVLFPAISTLLVPPERMQEEDSFVTLTDLHNLYKVFERC